MAIQIVQFSLSFFRPFVNFENYNQKELNMRLNIDFDYQNYFLSISGTVSTFKIPCFFKSENVIITIFRITAI